MEDTLGKLMQRFKPVLVGTKAGAGKLTTRISYALRYANKGTLGLLVGRQYKGILEHDLADDRAALVRDFKMLAVDHLTSSNPVRQQISGGRKRLNPCRGKIWQIGAVKVLDDGCAVVNVKEKKHTDEF